MMKSFKDHFCLEEQKNTHMTHLEDAVIHGGVDGVVQAINALRDMRDMLGGQKDGSVSVKWDGCVHEDTVILTNIGDMTIKEVVDRCQWDENLKVMGKDLESSTQPSHMVPVLAGMHETGSKDWVEIELEDGTTYKMTEDHEVHTSNRGWVKAKDLQDYDDVTEL